MQLKTTMLSFQKNVFLNFFFLFCFYKNVNIILNFKLILNLLSCLTIW